MSCLECNVGLEEMKTAISQKQTHNQAVRGFQPDVDPLSPREPIRRSIFSDCECSAVRAADGIWEEWGAIYSKQIFYLWQVMERATTVRRFNKGAQTNSGRTRLKWERLTSAWLWNEPWSHRLVYSGRLCIFGCMVEWNTLQPLIFSKGKDARNTIFKQTLLATS